MSHQKIARVRIFQRDGRYFWVLFDRNGDEICRSRDYAGRYFCRRSVSDTLRVWLPEGEQTATKEGWR